MLRSPMHPTPLFQANGNNFYHERKAVLRDIQESVEIVRTHASRALLLGGNKVALVDLMTGKQLVRQDILIHQHIRTYGCRVWRTHFPRSRHAHLIYLSEHLTSLTISSRVQHAISST